MDFYTRFSDDLEQTASSYGKKSDQYALHKILLDAKEELRKNGKMYLEKQCKQEYLLIYVCACTGYVSLMVKQHWSVDRTKLRKKKETELKKSIDNFVTYDLYDMILNKGYKITKI